MAQVPQVPHGRTAMAEGEPPMAIEIELALMKMLVKGTSLMHDACVCINCTLSVLTGLGIDATLATLQCFLERLASNNDDATEKWVDVVMECIHHHQESTVESSGLASRPLQESTDLCRSPLTSAGVH